MNRIPAYVSFRLISVCLAVILTACGQTASVDLPDVDAAVAETETGPAPLSKTKASPPAQTEESPAEALKPIDVFADPYLTANFSQFYTRLSIECMSRGEVAVNLKWGPTPESVARHDGSGTIFNGASGQEEFWKLGLIYFDGVVAVFPGKFLYKSKQVPTGNGGFETRSERVPTGQDPVRDVLLPNLKTAKTMRIKNRDGLGPTFDLTAINADVERLEAECTGEEATIAE